MGKIYITGIGPGDFENMTLKAFEVLSFCDTIIGYNVYTELVKQYFKDKEFLSTGMTKEYERCVLCFEKAMEGKNVVLVCSGDAGIYGMAELMYHTGKAYPDIQLEVVPGVTAASSGAALLGAPLIQDFAVISLSDLLTPWEKIEKRILAAAYAGMIICFYNPSSKKRAGYLKKACQLVLKYASPETVCGITENIGRQGEAYKVCTLKELMETPVNMFTTVFIGNSQTEIINGKMVTPRGYKTTGMRDKPVLLFGGTSEGRKLAELFDSNNIRCTVCVATEYGEQLISGTGNITVICGRMDLDDICRLIEPDAGGSQFSYVIDATHPYASLISENVKRACTRTGTVYLRLLRDNIYNNKDNDIKFFEDASQAAEYLDKVAGRILLTTGSKDLPVFCGGITDKSRITARVLPSVNAIEICSNSGLNGKQIIAMQGPFSKETNIALIKQSGARFIVMKESGRAGGFPEKIAAAKETGTDIIILKRPVEETGYTFNDIIKTLGLKDGGTDTGNNDLHKEIVLAGMGMGNKGTITIDGLAVLEEAELVIGTGRLLETAGSVVNMLCKEVYNAYDAGLIFQYIKEHPHYKKIAVLLSGDTGFYSGAKKLEEVLSELQEYNIKIIPGISSVVYFASKLKTDWQDIKLISLHGRMQNIINAIKNNKKTFVLLGAKDSVAGLAGLCIQYGLLDVKLYIGHNLGYSDEEIITGSPSDFTEYINNGFLYCAIIENPSAGNSIATHGLPDSQFIRGNVPMTKEEIRSVSVSKLHLVRDAVVYDIGAGTGSVAVECARIAYNGKVYAIEKNSGAVNLIKQNKLLHGAFNLEIVNGTAPGILERLEPPTHVFIGGSSGKLSQIIDIVFAKNNNARIVINAVTLETVADVQRIIGDNKSIKADISYISVSKAKALGNYNIMQALNPVWIIVIEQEVL